MSQTVPLSHSFRRQAAKAVTSIALFAVVYLLLILLAISLVVVCGFIAIKMLLLTKTPLIVFLAIGIVIMSFIVLYAVVRFMFNSVKVDRSGMLEITEQAEPNLFRFINDVAYQVRAPRPKRIYLTADVNASVFYDSSFLSMFLPVRKNLQVGVGLLNTMTVSEFRAIIGHEFGHFSQRSMKTGSYVHYVNQVIYNALYHNNSYGSWGENLPATLALPVRFSAKIIQGIQWVLKSLYPEVNLQYLRLSREMEYHADATGASVAGREALRSGLLRLPMCEAAMTAVFEFYRARSDDKIRSADCYNEQSVALRLLAEDNGISIVDELPVVTLADYERFNRSKLHIEDQWSTHPSLRQRTERLEQLPADQPSVETDLAISLLTNPARTKRYFTDQIFTQPGSVDTDNVELPLVDFEQRVAADRRDNSFPSVYRGYYDQKDVIRQPSTEILDTNPVANELFTDETVSLVYEASGLRSDLAMLRYIADGQSDIKTFDYDGIRYQVADVARVIEQCEARLASLLVHIGTNDSKIYHYFHQVDIVKNGENALLAQLYSELESYTVYFSSALETLEELHTRSDFMRHTLPFNQIEHCIKNMANAEDVFKQRLKQGLDEGWFSEAITPEITDHFQEYLGTGWIYFAVDTYFDDEVSRLFTAMGYFHNLLHGENFRRKKKLLEYQAELLPLRDVQTSEEYMQIDI
ncbi:M48 family metalloprotease [Parapedobacter sp. GCM10030251]|uniref:M48 family metalloprotease n=1 Tax=Parapedobacter sp. GCM10030251 TaxID=3273419 RepID=UPI00360F093B